MNLKKKSKVVMLPTKDNEAIDCPFIKCVGFDNKLNIIGKPLWNNETWQGQHIHILSDERADGGDYVIYDNNTYKVYIDESPGIYHGRLIIHVGCGIVVLGAKDMKIIASTDKSLNLPEPSPQFVEKFVEEYNKGNVITDVNVEFIYNVTNEDWSKRPVQLDGFYSPKIDKNNFITITKIKESWNKDEIKELFNKFRKDFPLHRGIQIMDNDLDTWINENL